MSHITTMRTAELTPLALSEEAAARAKLTGICRIDEADGKTSALSPVLHRLKHQSVKPAVELPTGAFPQMLLFPASGDLQILEDQHCIGRSPLTERCRSLPAERLIPVSGFPGQPFQRTADAFRVRALCLLPGEFGLEAGANLAGSLVAYGELLSTDDQRSFLGRGNQGIVDAKVNPDWNGAFRVWNLESETKRCFAVVPNDQAIDRFGLGQISLKPFRNSVIDTLTAVDSPDRECTVFTERSVAAGLANQKQGSRSFEKKWLADRSTIGFGGTVCRRCQPDRRTAKLGGKRSWYLMINYSLELNCAKRLAGVESNRRNCALIPIEFFDSCRDIRARLEDNRDCAFNIHTKTVSLLLEEYKG